MLFEVKNDHVSPLNESVRALDSIAMDEIRRRLT